MIKQIYKLIKKEKHIIRFILILFLVGVVSGTLFINYISYDDKVTLINQISNYSNNINILSKDVYGISVFVSDIKGNLLQFLFIYLLGISVFGIFIVIFIIYFKGFIYGVTLSSFILKFKFKGILTSLIYTVFYILPNIMCYTFIGFFSIYISIRVIKAFIKKDSLNFKNFLGRYIISFFISLLLITILSLIDSYLLPLILRML